KGVSRRHFSLIRNEADWLLKDLGSTNGTRLNGSLVKESIIKPDDVIHAGIVEFKVRELDKQRVVQLPVEKSRSVRSENTAKVGDVASSLQESIFTSSRVVFPEGMIPGKSQRMMEIYQRIHSLAESNVNILLTGETGTGKEMFAHMLHLSGKRANG